jgi:hypothetical protein
MALALSFSTKGRAAKGCLPIDQNFHRIRAASCTLRFQ